MIISILITVICLVVSVWCKAKADRMVIEFINLPYINQQTVRPNWFCFNPLNKYNNGKYGTGIKQWTIPFLNIKTSFLVTNFSDGWHFVNSLAICSILIPFTIATMYAIGHISILAFIVLYIVYGLTWNELFAFMYAANKIKK